MLAKQVVRAWTSPLTPVVKTCPAAFKQDEQIRSAHTYNTNSMKLPSKSPGCLASLQIRKITAYLSPSINRQKRRRNQ
jgi:hypothetical protein